MGSNDKFQSWLFELTQKGDRFANCAMCNILYSYSGDVVDLEN